MQTTMKVALEDLQNTLAQVRPCVHNSAGDITSHYVFRPHESDGVAVYGWTGKTFAFAPINGTTYEGVDAFTIEAKRLDIWLSTLSESAVIDFAYDEGVVSAVAPRGKIVFQSLDPASFPWWDQLWNASEVTGRVRADLFRAAINHSRPFISDDETKQPKLCVVECIEGTLRCTDLTAMCQTSVPGIEGVNVRLHGKDLGALNSFLALQSDGEVTIYETDRAQFFAALGGKGAVFGESRPLAKFPKVTVDENYTEMWELDREELLLAIRFLASGAAWDDNTLHIVREDGEVTLSMTSTSGEVLTQTVKSGIEHECDEASFGFNISRLHLQRLLGLCKEDTIWMRSTRKDKGGWITIVEEPEEGFKFSTAITWMFSRQKTTSVNTNVSAVTNTDTPTVETTV